MLGAITGDIIGSIYEWRNIKTKEFPLFSANCHFTDDTVMTCAVADAIINGGTKENFIKSMKKFGRMYPYAGYGGNFSAWLIGENNSPYNSFGNGSAMRVSPCGWVYDCTSLADTSALEQTIQLAKLSAEVTHNHPEGIKGAMATASAIFLCRHYYGGFSGENLDDKEIKSRIKHYIENKFGYDLSKTLEEIRPSYFFDVSCQGSVPQAIIAFLESTDFEDAIRNAISIGGDSDTIGAITGSIAEAAYGIPPKIKQAAISFLDDPLQDTLKKWQNFLCQSK